MIVERFEQFLRARHQSLVAGARMLNLLGKQRDVGLAKTVVLLERVGHSRLLQRLRHQVGVRAAAEMLAGKRVGDAEGLFEGARHGAKPGAAAQEQGAVDVKKDQCGFHFRGCLGAWSANGSTE